MKHMDTLPEVETVDGIHLIVYLVVHHYMSDIFADLAKPGGKNQ